MATKKTYSFKKATAVSENNGIKAGRYDAKIIGVNVYERIILKDTQYENAGDIVPEFSPIVLVDLGDGKTRVETFYGIKNKFSRGKSNNSKGFNLVKELEGLTDGETEALIKELSDEDGNYEFGWFFDKEVVAVFENNKAGDRTNLTALKPAGKDYVSPDVSAVEIPEFLMSFETKDGAMWRKNLFSGLIDEVAEYGNNADLLEATEASHEV